MVCGWTEIPRGGIGSGLGPELQAEIHFQPFELNPGMGPEGQDIVEHIAQKYGSSAADIGRSQEALRARGEAVGFHFDFGKRGRIYNTLQSARIRLLHWAEAEGEAVHAEKRALQCVFH